MRRLVASLFVLTGAAASAAAQVTPPKAPASVVPALPGATPAINHIDRIVAVVGNKPILWSEVLEQIYLAAQGKPLPSDSSVAMGMARDIINNMIDQEVLIAAAKQFKIDIPDTDLQETVEKKFKELRARYKSDAEFRDALRGGGFGTETEYRKFLLDQARRDGLQTKAVDSLRARGRLAAPVSVTEQEVTDAFEKAKGNFPKRPATVAFRQLVVRPKGSPAAIKAAREKAEALIAELNKKGADFEQIAKRETMDPTTKETGGDLGWNRRGTMVPEFDRMMFALVPGVVSPFPVETSFGFHIIRVDRVQPAEVKARHILIVPVVDSADVAYAGLRADSALALWKAGTSFDTLVVRYHDNAEVKGATDGMPIDDLPPEYKTALEGVTKGGFAKPFAILDPRGGKPKYFVVQVIDRQDGGEYTVADYRERIRTGLQQEKQYRRLIDQLRREQFVVIKL